MSKNTAPAAAGILTETQVRQIVESVLAGYEIDLDGTPWEKRLRALEQQLKEKCQCALKAQKPVRADALSTVKPKATPEPLRAAITSAVENEAKKTATKKGTK